MKKPVIGIVGVPYEDKDGYFAIQFLQEVLNSVIKSGAIGIGINPTQGCDYKKPGLEIPKITSENESDMLYQLQLCDAIIQPGGKRIYFYQKFIHQYALEKDVPYLGICAGMQMMANYNSEKTILDSVPNEMIDHQKPHEININKNTKLYDIVGKTSIEMVSRHTKCITKPASIFDISAYAPDGTIEAIEIPNLKFHIGLQSHPERFITREEQAVFECLIESTKPKIYTLK